MKISIFSHKGTNLKAKSAELRRDDIDCIEEADIDREVEVLKGKGWTVQEVLRQDISSQEKTATGRQPRNRR